MGEKIQQRRKVDRPVIRKAGDRRGNAGTAQSCPCRSTEAERKKVDYPWNTNPLLFWIAVVFSLVNVADVTLALQGSMVSETNPIWLLTNSPALLILGKSAMIVIVMWATTVRVWPKHWHYYAFILTIMLGIILMGLGAYTGIIHLNDPVSSDAYGSTLSTHEKISAYSWIVGLIFIFPFFVSMLAFIIYNKSYIRIRFEEDGRAP